MRKIIAILMCAFLTAPAWAGGKSLEDLIWNGDTAKAISVLKGDPSQINQAVSGYTLLHLASMVGNYEVAEYLVRNGADVNAVDYEGYSPLVRAKANRNAKIVELLVAKGGKELRP